MPDRDLGVVPAPGRRPYGGRQVNARDRSPAASRTRIGRAALRLVLAAAVVGLLPAATDDGGVARAAQSDSGRAAVRDARPAMPPVAPPGDAAGLAPGVAYEEALAHAGDRIAFTPGGRVSVPFTPRSGDGWTVGGSTPRPLPTGRATGRQMATSPQGSSWATTTPPQVDRPSRTPSRTPIRPSAGSGATPDGTPGQTGAAPVDLRTVGASALAPGALATASAPAASTGRSPMAAKGLRRQVFGFLPYWELADPSLRLDYDLLSTIAYFSVGVTREGDLLKRNPDGTVSTGWSGWTSSQLTKVIDAAHRRGTRVVLTLSMFAWTTGQANIQAALLADPAARKNLARQAAAAVRDRGADGINLDVEPLVAGREDDFVALVRSIRAELDRVSPGYQLTFDTTGRIGNYPVDALTAPGAADAVFVMGYDYRTAGSPVAGAIAPLAGPGYDLAETVLAYLDEVPASKIILGVPWYGRAWSTISDELNARTQTGPKFGATAAVAYAQAVEASATYGARWDGREQVSWFAYERENCTTTYGCVTSWRQVYYDDDRALRLKYDLVNRSGIRGVGIWALGYDGGRAEVWDALADKFLRDTTPPEAGIVAFAPEERDEGFVVDWTARDDYNGVAGYDVQVSIDGGAWTPWLSGTTAGADVWLGRDGHGYAFRVRATDRKGNVGAWETTTTYVAEPTLAVGGFARVLVDGLTARARPGTSGKRRDSLAAGAIVWITDGPLAVDGYTWYQVIGPIVEWNPVSAVSRAWVAASGGGSTLLAPVRAPNSTRVAAGIAGFSFGAVGEASVGSSTAAAARRAFSPNGDDSQDTLRLDWTSRVAFDTLSLNVYRPDGTLLGSRPVAARDAGEASFAWDGRVGGAVLPDGTYLVQLVGTAGRLAYSAPSVRPATPAQLAAYAVTIDTVAPTAGKASISGRRISPNGDGRLDSLTVAASAKGANRWSFTVAPLVGGAAGPFVRAVGGAGSSATLAWDGTADDGTVVPDGVYRVTMRTLDWAGNGPVTSWDVVVDTRDPAVLDAATPPAISPDGDGAADRMAIAWTSDEPVRGQVRILRGTTVVRRWPQASGLAGRVSWNGTDDRGRPVRDGRYAVELELTDASGNRVVRRTAITVDRTAGILRWTPTAFLPDGDGRAETASVDFRLTRAATTSLRVEDPTGRVVRNAWKDRKRGTGRVSWTWDGRDGHRQVVPPGRYVAVLTATGPLGTTELRRTLILDAFVVILSATEPAAGDTLTVTIRSVEPLRAAPSVTFTQAGLAPVRVRAAPGPKGVYEARLTVAAAGSATIVVAGRDAGGATNVTRLAVTVR